LAGLVRFDKGCYQLAEDLGKRTLIMYGDGLSCERFRNCKEHLIEQQGSFSAHYENVTVLLTALQKVYMLPGDLHGGRFHTLGPVYSLFYGGFLQPIQLALGYKRISNKKVEKTFEQASILVLRVRQETERAMYDAFLFEMERDSWDGMTGLIADVHELATYLADRLEKWIDQKLTSSTDEMFKFGLNFIKVSRGYRLFGEAIRSGSVITIEHLWIKFCRIWK